MLWFRDGLFLLSFFIWTEGAEQFFCAVSYAKMIIFINCSYKLTLYKKNIKHRHLSRHYLEVYFYQVPFILPKFERIVSNLKGNFSLPLSSPSNIYFQQFHYPNIKIKNLLNHVENLNCNIYVYIKITFDKYLPIRIWRNVN